MPKKIRKKIAKYLHSIGVFNSTKEGKQNLKTLNDNDINELYMLMMETQKEKFATLKDSIINLLTRTAVAAERVGEKELSEAIALIIKSDRYGVLAEINDELFEYLDITSDSTDEDEDADSPSLTPESLGRSIDERYNDKAQEIYKKNFAELTGRELIVVRNALMINEEPEQDSLNAIAEKAHQEHEEKSQKLFRKAYKDLSSDELHTLFNISAVEFEQKSVALKMYKQPLEQCSSAQITQINSEIIKQFIASHPNSLPPASIIPQSGTDEYMAYWSSLSQSQQGMEVNRRTNTRIN